MGDVMRILYRGRRFVAAAAVLIAAMACGALSPAIAQPQVIVVSGADKHAGEFIIPVNKSQVLRLDVPLKDLLIGNAEIADVLALTDRTIYLLGKSIGSTSLTLYGRDKELIAVMDIVVTYDIDGIKTKLFETLPEEDIEVRAVGSSIMLSGIVSSSSRISDIMKITSNFTGGEGNITNLMTVQGSQQVMLQVRFTEVSRGLGRDIDANFAILGDDFNLISGLDNVVSDFVTTGSAVGVVNKNLGGGFSLSLFFNALESKGAARTLAEPNLIALSGETASFLAGGEFPVPVNQDDGDGITIEFKEFGISLAFTPTVLADGLINIVLALEESSIDNTITAAQQTVGSSFNIVPGLVTRRANTTVELRDGQSFVIAGLLRDDYNDTVSQFPFLGDLPVLGALFRSADFARAESELMILITPRLVQPVAAGSLAAVGDNYLRPSDVDLFLFGRVEAPGSGMPLQVGAVGSNALAAQSAGGIDGAYGHIIK